MFMGILNNDSKNPSPIARSDLDQESLPGNSGNYILSLEPVSF